MPEIVGRLRTPRLANAPTSPALGEVYYDTGTNTLYWWNGTSWISASGVDLVYNGDFPANTPYTDGDIVVSNGVAYMCVLPTNAAPTPWPGGPSLAPPPVLKPSYGTNFPVSPIDGQEAILVDSVTNPTYQWRFRYNAGSSSAYKWEYIGGVAATSIVETAESVSSTSYGDIATIGPQFVVPRSGEYEVMLEFVIQIGAANNWVCVSPVVTINTVPNWFGSPSLAQAFGFVNPTGGIGYFTTSYSARGPVSAGANLKMVYAIAAQAGTGAPTCGRRKLFVTPVRVS